MIFEFFMKIALQLLDVLLNQLFYKDVDLCILNNIMNLIKKYYKYGFFCILQSTQSTNSAIN